MKSWARKLGKGVTSATANYTGNVLEEKRAKRLATYNAGVKQAAYDQKRNDDLTDRAEDRKNTLTDLTDERAYKTGQAGQKNKFKSQENKREWIRDQMVDNPIDFEGIDAEVEGYIQESKNSGMDLWNLFGGQDENLKNDFGGDEASARKALTEKLITERYPWVGMAVGEGVSVPGVSSSVPGTQGTGGPAQNPGAQSNQPAGAQQQSVKSTPKPAPRQLSKSLREEAISEIGRNPSARKEILKGLKERGIAIDGDLYDAIHGEGKFKSGKKSVGDQSPGLEEKRAARLKRLTDAGVNMEVAPRKEPVDIYADEKVLKGAVGLLGDTAKYAWNKFDEASTAIVGEAVEAGSEVAKTVGKAADKVASKHNKTKAAVAKDKTTSANKLLERFKKAPTKKMARQILHGKTSTKEAREIARDYLKAMGARGTKK